jgi:ring-1,2-phenylacetyl-CoA epoxidase subunit PaaD
MVTPEQQALADVTARAGSTPPAADAIWRALDRVPDPEIPAVSVVELGMVRGIAWDHGDLPTLVVRVTPTYSACPATDVIVQSIREALFGLGIDRVRVDIELAPPWTTDWIGAAARDKLRAYGIAPPAPVPPQATVGSAAIGTGRRPAAAVACPRCGSLATTRVTQFGSTACKAQYRCADCCEPFDYFKPL